MLDFNATVDFDRLYHEYGNMLKTGLGMLEAAHNLNKEEEKMTVKTQGKANVLQRPNLQKKLDD